MALLAEELVEEWLNRQGYFTIRGAKVGVHEIDLLAIRSQGEGLERRHIEVQASLRPIGYISPLTSADAASTGQGRNNARKRTEAELRGGVVVWVERKYANPKKESLRQALAPGEWSRELVLHRVRDESEVRMIEELDVRVTRLDAIVADLARGGTMLQGGAGTNFAELIAIGPSQTARRPAK